MKSALYAGKISHRRYIPKNHAFSYPFFMYFLCLDDLEKQADIGLLFSVRRWALNRFHRPDYLGERRQPLAEAVKMRMEEMTGKSVEGKVYGLVNLRTLGLYFSPVNFYYGFDKEGRFTHFLAEVSNIPWNERHHYCHFIQEEGLAPRDTKAFKVSPFNPIDQHYRWQLTAPEDTLSVGLQVHDERGHIFDATLSLQRYPLTLSSLFKRLVRRPVMTASIVGAIYWQAFRLYRKGVAYIPYRKKHTLEHPGKKLERHDDALAQSNSYDPSHPRVHGL